MSKYAKHAHYDNGERLLLNGIDVALWEATLCFK